MKRLYSRRGITLVELMSIVVIIGIIAAMAVPRFATTINRLRFRNAARHMVSMLRLARSHAITNKQPFGVYMDGTALTLTMFQDSQNPGTFTFEAGDSVITVDTLPHGFIYVGTDFGSQTLVYRPNGSASNTGNIHFLAYNPGEDISIGSINVLASTGRTKLGPLYFY